MCPEYGFELRCVQEHMHRVIIMPRGVVDVASSAPALRPPDHVGEEHLTDLLGVGFALSPLPTFLLDDQLIIAAANGSAQQLFGSAPRSLLGTSIAELGVPGRADPLTRDFATLRTGERAEQELELITASGARIVAEGRGDGITSRSGRHFI